MADTKREIERKYDVGADAELPDLTEVPGVGEVLDKGVVELDAVYWDTPDQRLAAASITLRRRTGGTDAGWHLKLPVSLAEGVRDEIHAPLSDTVPGDLLALVRSRVREAELVPLVRLLSARDLRHLVDSRGELLAEVSIDAVRAERLAKGGGTAAWSEIEVELADGGDPALLDKVEKKLKKAGVRRSTSSSKLGRALAQTAPKGRKAEKAGLKPAEGAVRLGKKAGKSEAVAEAVRESVGDGRGSAGDHLVAYLRAQRDAIVSLDPAVRRDLPDAVHQMRVATRRMRSAFKSYRKILDHAVTDPVGDELKWLAAELGVDRDQEVLAARFAGRMDALPKTLLLGPVDARLRIWSTARGADARRGTLAVLESERYLALLDAVDTLLAAPPLRPAASAPPGKALPKALLKDYARLATRVEHALALAPGQERDRAMHEARKAAKRARYAGEAAVPALGTPARRFAKRMKAVQSVLGDHQDSVVAREAVRALGTQAHLAGESAFTWGLLYGREEAVAADRERELPEVWAKASEAKIRAALGS
ncbi:MULTISPECIES: CYTH and CHAD domain-containing protein [unclassified Streptomyces]|uniref:CYTH and CHAD domain-containing protein n=1 Tax=unclassified Streptomyces TaxID=2593676 RepID=UPI001CBF6B25|nr:MULTISPECIES: CYTH and CHAD domain-containing protein [unclassified Streptomyces]WPO73765.1 CYTH and CHAD domain-containing protein [Streptomyces sp. KN37]